MGRERGARMHVPGRKGSITCLLIHTLSRAGSAFVPWAVKLAIVRMR